MRGFEPMSFEQTGVKTCSIQVNPRKVYCHIFGLIDNSAFDKEVPVLFLVKPFTYNCYSFYAYSMKTPQP